MRVEKELVVNAPVDKVYRLWTDFENFPRFMDNVDEVRRTGEDTLHWKAKIGGRTVEWDARVVGLVENRTVTWRSTSGAENAGAVTLAAKGNQTIMNVVIEYEPSLLEAVIDTVTRFTSRSVEEDLERFKRLAEGLDPDREEQLRSERSPVARAADAIGGSAWEREGQDAGWERGEGGGKSWEAGSQGAGDENEGLGNSGAVSPSAVRAGQAAGLMGGARDAISGGDSDWEREQDAEGKEGLLERIGDTLGGEREHWEPPAEEDGGNRAEQMVDNAIANLRGGDWERQEGEGGRAGSALDSAADRIAGDQSADWEGDRAGIGGRVANTVGGTGSDWEGEGGSGVLDRVEGAIEGGGDDWERQRLQRGGAGGGAAGASAGSETPGTTSGSMAGGVQSGQLGGGEYGTGGTGTGSLGGSNRAGTQGTTAGEYGAGDYEPLGGATSDTAQGDTTTYGVATSDAADGDSTTYGVAGAAAQQGNVDQPMVDETAGSTSTAAGGNAEGRSLADEARDYEGTISSPSDRPDEGGLNTGPEFTLGGAGGAVGGDVAAGTTDGDAMGPSLYIDEATGITGGSDTDVQTSIGNSAGGVGGNTATMGTTGADTPAGLTSATASDFNAVGTDTSTLSQGGSPGAYAMPVDTTRDTAPLGSQTMLGDTESIGAGGESGDEGGYRPGGAGGAGGTGGGYDMGGYSGDAGGGTATGGYDATGTMSGAGGYAPGGTTGGYDAGSETHGGGTMGGGSSEMDNQPESGNLFAGGSGSLPGAISGTGETRGTGEVRDADENAGTTSGGGGQGSYGVDASGTGTMSGLGAGGAPGGTADDSLLDDETTRAGGSADTSVSGWGTTGDDETGSSGNTGRGTSSGGEVL